MFKSLPFYFILSFFASCFLLISCIAPSVPFRTYTDPYGKITLEKEKLSLLVIHDDERFSTVNYTFDASWLTSKKNESDSVSRVIYRVSCRIQDKMTNRKSGDSTVALFREVLPANENHRIAGKIKMKLPQGAKYIMDVAVQDVLTGNRKTTSIFVNKTNKQVAQNYALYTDSVHLLFDTNFALKQDILFQNNRDKSVVSGTVTFTSFFKDIALPPFFTERKEFAANPISDHFSIVRLGDFFHLKLERPGIYFFRTSDDVQDGLSLTCFLSPMDQILSFRYITTQSEFDSLISKKNNVEGEKEFWINFAGNQQRASVLHNAWMKRMEHCNYFFSSDREGWKTDRGMIYLLFGSPPVVQRSMNAESWIYHNDVVDDLVFDFKKEYNSFTENDFQLVRNSDFKQIWYTAVDAWRQGRIYFGNKLN